MSLSSAAPREPMPRSTERLGREALAPADRKDDAWRKQLPTFTRGEVTARGFEARCTTDDSVEYLWHLGFGLRADLRSGSRTLLTDPAAVPTAPG